MRGLLALIAIEVARLAASRARTGAVTLAPADATVEALRRLVEEHFRKERLISFYADKLAMTPDRLNDHVKRVDRRHRRPSDPPARADRGQARSWCSPASRSTRCPTISASPIRRISRASSASRPG